MEETQVKLDPQVVEKIKSIAAKDPSELLDTDKEFMRARKSYFGKASRQKFAEVFAETPVAPSKPKETKTEDTKTVDPKAQTTEKKKKPTTSATTDTTNFPPVNDSEDTGEDEVGDDESTEDEITE